MMQLLARSRPFVAPHPLAAPFVVGAVALLAGLLVMTPWMVGAFYDDGTYLVLAKALATGQGYRHLNLPGSPEATHFPPGYPILLALCLRIAPDFQTGIAIAKLVNAALLPAVAIGSYGLCRRTIGWPIWAAAIVSLLGVLAPGILAMNAALMSETLFLALLFPALMRAEALARGEGQWRTALAVGLLIGALQLVRSVGLPLLGALLILLAMRRRWRDMAIVMAGTGAVVAPWLGWVSRHSPGVSPALSFSYGSYRDWIQPALESRGWPFIAQVGVHNLSAHASYLGYRFVPWHGTLPTTLGFLCVVGAAVAAIVMLRRTAPVTLLFLGGYIALVLVWPFAPDRFYYLLEPFFAICVAAAIGEGWDLWSRRTTNARRAAVVVIAAAAVLCVGFVVDETVSIRTRRWESRQRLVHGALTPVVRWVATRTPPDAVVATDIDPMVYLYTGRRAVPIMNFRAEYYLYPRADSAAIVLRDTRELLTELRPDFVVVRRAAPEVQNVLARTLPGLPLHSTLAGELKAGGSQPERGVVLGLA
ncbi:MAG: hypothetical protein ACYC1S_11630 [Gemmatimonadaceae bacterium]